MLLFVAWNAWALWLFRRPDTGLLPGQAAHAVIEEGPYRFSRNPLYVGMLALHVGLAAPTATFWDSSCFRPRCCSSAGGAIRDEERYLHEGLGTS